MYYIYAIDLPDIVVAAIESLDTFVWDTDGTIQDSCQGDVSWWPNLAVFHCVGKTQINFHDNEVRVHQLFQSLSFV